MISLYKIFKSDQLKIGEKVEIKPSVLQRRVVTHNRALGQEDGTPSFIHSFEEERQMLLEQAEDEVSEIIRSAEREAAEILEKSYIESKSTMEKYREKGYSDGYEKGMAEGRETGYLEMESLIMEAKLLKQQAYDEKNKLAHELEEEIVQLVIQTSRRILQAELQENQELLFQLIEEGLKKCNYTENLIIHVSDMDYDMVYAYQNRIYLMTDGIYDIAVKSDPSMSPGSLVIETASGQVDAGVETQLKQIEVAFRELLQSEESP